METQNRFELNQAIEIWRQSLANRSGPAMGDIVEMETHLHEEHTALMQTGLSEEEAFVIASKRLGPPVPLAEEFAKAVPERIWRERLFWIAAVLLLLNLLEEVMGLLFDLIAQFVIYAIPVVSSISHQWLALLIEVAQQAFIVGPVLLFIWYLRFHAGWVNVNLTRWFPTRLRLIFTGLLAIFVVELPIWFLVQAHLQNMSGSSYNTLMHAGGLGLAATLFSILFMPVFLLTLMAWALPSAAQRPTQQVA